MRAARADQSQLPQRWNYSFYKAAHKIWNVNQSALNCIWIRVGRLFAFLFMEYFHNFFLNSASLICNILRSNKQIRHNFCNTSHLCWHGGQTGPHTAAPSPPCFNSQHILQRRPPPIYESQPPSCLSVCPFTSRLPLVRLTLLHSPTATALSVRLSVSAGLSGSFLISLLPMRLSLSWKGDWGRPFSHRLTTGNRLGGGSVKEGE